MSLNVSAIDLRSFWTIDDTDLQKVLNLEKNLIKA
jgi:hypothetical protein